MVVVLCVAAPVLYLGANSDREQADDALRVCPRLKFQGSHAHSDESRPQEPLPATIQQQSNNTVVVEAILSLFPCFILAIARQTQDRAGRKRTDIRTI